MVLTLNLMEEIIKYSNCFICGDKNLYGLKAKFFFDGNQAITEVIAGKNFEGYRNIYHGGIISSLLDEVMVKALLAENKYAVTAELKVKFIAPVKVGDKIKFFGRLVKQKGRLYFTEGETLGEEGQIFARASAKYIEADEKMLNQLMKSVG